MDADAFAGPEAQALALRYGMDSSLPAQSFALVDTVCAVVFDPQAGAGWELTLLEYGPPHGWFALTAYPPTEDAAGLARAAAWLLRHHSPLAS